MTLVYDEFFREEVTGRTGLSINSRLQRLQTPTGAWTTIGVGPSNESIVMELRVRVGWERLREVS